MKKMFILIKASMSEGMNIFKINTKKSNSFSKVILPVILSLGLMGMMYSYSELLMESLEPIHMEFVLLTIAILLTSILTLIEGIYKSSSLLFNLKDDNLLLSLPIKKSSVLFVRVFKFYIFELMYNSLFLLPSILVYAVFVKPSFIYYIVSILGILLFPIIPILISSLIGTIISFLASKFQSKNYAQTLLTILFLLVIMYFSYNFNYLINNISKHAKSINDLITKLYFPAGMYIELITKFSFIKLLKFILIHIILFIVSIALIGKVYFNINSNFKIVKSNKRIKNYSIKYSTPFKSLIRKEFNRFINSTVFVTNAGFGLVLYFIGCIFITIKFNNVVNFFTETYQEFTIDYIMNCLPVILFGFIIFTSFMTSITSSMISLEGKSLNILKSMPIKSYTIIKAKVLTALLMMLPFIIIGDLIIFIKFKFDIVSILLILISSVLFPLVSETIGIIVNLKYPRMDFKNDTEVVKQSLSAFISVFIGILVSLISIYVIYNGIDSNINNNYIMLMFIIVFLVVYGILNRYLNKNCEKLLFNISI